MRIKITDIHPDDSFYNTRDEYIGRCGEFTPIRGRRPEGFSCGRVVLENPSADEELAIDMIKASGLGEGFIFYGIKFDIVSIDLAEEEK